MIKLDDFLALLEEGNCADLLSPHLRALCHDHLGDWDRAHEIVQEMDDFDAARIHAYLHRKEGDVWNSRYWHRRAGTLFRDDLTLEEEWLELVKAMLQR
ncbi:MAG TPA: hypothetical protein EYP90_02495 [Chromatiaceae bacterium]|nr:hypothetical protein [Chromatiaceae bacterium]